jgi:cell wall-associated NlpC family hydrolase
MLSRSRARFRAYLLTSIAVVIMTVVPAEAAFAAAPATTAPVAQATVPAAIPDPAASVASTATLNPAADASASTTPPAAVAPTAPTRPATIAAASVVVALARTHLGARYRSSATGPSSFDCSGLVWRVFEQARLGRKVTSRTARAIYLAYRDRGLASRSHPQVGDLVVWGYGSHVGIYIGRGLAISALVGGVRVHRVNALTTPFTAYLHTHLAGLRLPARIVV